MSDRASAGSDRRRHRAVACTIASASASLAVDFRRSASARAVADPRCPAVAIGGPVASECRDRGHRQRGAVQRRVAGAIRHVHLGAAIEQKAGHRQVRAESRGTARRRRRALARDELLPQRIPLVQRRQQRRGAVRRRDVHVHTGIQQDPRRLQIVFLHREQQRVLAALFAGVRSVVVPGNAGLADRAGGRRVDRGRDIPGFRSGVHVRSVFHQQAHGLRMPGGPHQRRLAEFLLARIDVRAAIEQHLHDLDLPQARRRHQRRLAVLARQVRIGAVFEQQLHDVRGAVGDREVERTDPLFIGQIRIGARLQQQRRDLAIARAPPPRPAPSRRRLPAH